MFLTVLCSSPFTTRDRTLPLMFTTVPNTEPETVFLKKQTEGMSTIAVDRYMFQIGDQVPCLKARLSPLSLTDVISTLVPFELYQGTHLTLRYKEVFHFSPPLQTLSAILLMLKQVRIEHVFMVYIMPICSWDLWEIICRDSHQQFLSSICTHCSCQQEKKFLSLPLESGWPGDLLWPVECSRSNVMWLLDLGLKKPLQRSVLLSWNLDTMFKKLEIWMM